MINWLRIMVLALAGVVALPGPGVAQGTAEIAKRWGLLGTWAIDCGKPASGSNGYLSYVVRGGAQVSHERDFGDRQDVNAVQKLSVGHGGALELVIDFPALKHARKFTVLMGPDGRIKAMSNSKVDGTEPTIKAGKFTANGGETPWQTRCR